MGIVFGIVLTAAAARIVLQLRNRNRLFLSDAFLLFACISLCTGTGLLYTLCDDLYFDQLLLIDPALVIVTPNVFHNVAFSLKILFLYQTIMWTVIFSVKASFLCFFKLLLQRLPKFSNWWTWVTVITALCYVFCTVDAWIICPHFGVSSRKYLFCSQHCLEFGLYSNPKFRLNIQCNAHLIVKTKYLGQS